MSERRSSRKLETVLFTDIVGSTDIAAKLGDARWRELVSRHHQIVRRQLKRFGGREVDTAGDGVFSVFDVPAMGIRCACAVAEEVQELGIDIRAGLHVGEVEIVGREVRGIAVHTGARVCGIAGPSEVLVTANLKELVAGSGLEFSDRGSQELKGLDGDWHVFDVSKIEGTARSAPLDERIAEERRAKIVPTPLVQRHRLLAIGSVVAIAVIVVSVALVRNSEGGSSRSTVPPLTPGGPPTGAPPVPSFTDGRVVVPPVWYADLDGDGVKEMVVASRPPQFRDARFLDVFSLRGATWVNVFSAAEAAPPGAGAPPTMLSATPPYPQRIVALYVAPLVQGGTPRIAVGIQQAGIGLGGPLEVWVISMMGTVGGSPTFATDFYTATEIAGRLTLVPGSGDLLDLERGVYSKGDLPSRPSQIEHETIGEDTDTGRIQVLSTTTSG